MRDVVVTAALTALSALAVWLVGSIALRAAGAPLALVGLVGQY